jgi:hypothetical protein
MVAIGVGGTLVEVINEIAWRRLPVTKADIDAMIDDTVLCKFLAAIRGAVPYDRQALAEFIYDFADLIDDLPEGGED